MTSGHTDSLALGGLQDAPLEFRCQTIKLPDCSGPGVRFGAKAKTFSTPTALFTSAYMLQAIEKDLLSGISLEHFTLGKSRGVE